MAMWLLQKSSADSELDDCSIGWLYS